MKSNCAFHGGSELNAQLDQKTGDTVTSHTVVYIQCLNSPCKLYSSSSRVDFLQPRDFFCMVLKTINSVFIAAAKSEFYI